MKNKNSSKSPPRIVLLIEESLRNRYKKLCKEKGITMSSQIVGMITSWVEEEELIIGIKNALNEEKESKNSGIQIPDEILQMGDPDSNFNPKEVFAAVSLISVIADNSVNKDEIRSLPQILRSIPLFKDSINQNEAVQLVNKQLIRLKKEKKEKYIENTLNSINIEIKDDVFKVAAAIVAADGNVSHDEREWLKRLKEHEISMESQSVERVNEALINGFNNIYNPTT